MKSVIRLTENEIHRMVNESVRRIMNEEQDAEIGRAFREAAEEDPDMTWGCSSDCDRMHDNGRSTLISPMFWDYDHRGAKLYTVGPDGNGEYNVPNFDYNMDNADTMDESIRRAIRKSLRSLNENSQTNMQALLERAKNGVSTWINSLMGENGQINDPNNDAYGVLFEELRPFAMEFIKFWMQKNNAQYVKWDLDSIYADALYKCGNPKLLSKLHSPKVLNKILDMYNNGGGIDKCFQYIMGCIKNTTLTYISSNKNQKVKPLPDVNLGDETRKIKPYSGDEYRSSSPEISFDVNSAINADRVSQLGGLLEDILQTDTLTPDQKKAVQYVLDYINNGMPEGDMSLTKLLMKGHFGGGNENAVNVIKARIRQRLAKIKQGQEYNDIMHPANESIRRAVRQSLRRL